MVKAQIYMVNLLDFIISQTDDIQELALRLEKNYNVKDVK